MKTREQSEFDENYKKLESLVLKAQVFADIYFDRDFEIRILDRKIQPIMLETSVFIFRAIDKTCQYFNVEQNEFKSHRRYRGIVEARNFYCHYVQTRKPISLTALGKTINRGHSLIINNRRNHEALLETNNEYAIKYTEYALFMDSHFIHSKISA